MYARSSKRCTQDVYGVVPPNRQEAGLYKICWWFVETAAVGEDNETASVLPVIVKNAF